MRAGEFDRLFGNLGYRFCRGNIEDAGVYYRYYQEGFHVVLMVNLDTKRELTPEMQHIMVERIQNIFYHPKGVLDDFPDGFPVYHVEVLTLLYGSGADAIRNLCASCKDTWGYLSQEKRLLIYENQPGDFWGLRSALENMSTACNAESGVHSPRTDIKSGINSMKSVPFITVAIMAVNILIFLGMEVVGSTSDNGFMLRCGAIYPPLISERHQWWRLFTAGFLHFGAEHLVNNMLILYCMGTRLEQAVGHIRMFVIYMFSLLGGSVLSYSMMMTTGDYAISAGASGAIFGVIGGVLWVVIWHHGHYAGISTRRMMFMILLTVYYGFASTGIDNWGHIGGVITGFLVTAILYHRKYQKD